MPANSRWDLIRGLKGYTFSAGFGALYGLLTLYMLPVLVHRLVENAFKVGETGATSYNFLPDILFCHYCVY